MSLKPGWAEAAGKAAGERDRQERAAKEKRPLSERQHLLDARRDYEIDRGVAAEGYGKKPIIKAADQWLKDAKKESAEAGAEFEAFFDRGVN